ncbi:MAG: hypothetical protein EXR18_04620 [Flavobacteriaceae bacterium]|nr:hypothetical protein [Flavobacteriaceae bacterium]
MTNKCKRVITSFFLVFCLPIVTMTSVVNKNAEIKSAIVKNVLYSSIVWVESKGNATARSKDGSLGIVQILPIMVKEVNRICKAKGIHKQFALQDRLNPDKSEQMFWIYQNFYNPKLNWETITMTEMEILARKWNGGPHGHTKGATKHYWKKVSRLVCSELKNKGISV